MKRTLMIAGSGGVVLLFIVGAVLLSLFSNQFLPGTYIGAVPVEGLTLSEAERVLRDRVDALVAEGVALRVDGTREERVILSPESFVVDQEISIARAWELGHVGPWYRRLWDRIYALTSSRVVVPAVTQDTWALEQDIALVSQTVDQPAKDVRLHVQGIKISILSDTASGLRMNAEQVLADVSSRLSLLDTSPVIAVRTPRAPIADPATAVEAKTSAERMIRTPLTLRIQDAEDVVLSRATLASWIITTYEGTRVIASINERTVSSFVTSVAGRTNIPAQNAALTIADGRVTSFTPPRSGLAVQEEDLVRAILAELDARASGSSSRVALDVPLKITKPQENELDPAFGITERIGGATTSFKGSPSNRVGNIKNGTKFLSGAIVRPGEEFSTIKTLGVIDNTQGYLPELVIRGDQTIPEFGGGLCQVSTTLFRAVMNASLPVTARRNHSYRVSYYENDGDGKFIGPGLDATIYEPYPDFRFKNDTAYPVLLYGFVKGDRITFELYGTADGRSSHIAGPTTLTEVPAGDPIYTDTDTLPRGVVKQIETPHPGGSAVANYTITYPDGTEQRQEFVSIYRPWPARFLVGTGEPVAPAAQ
ncbi:MAG: VanW family protein [Patescibacteria group bacterium]